MYANDVRGARLFGGIFALGTITLIVLRQFPPLPALIAAFFAVVIGLICLQPISGVQAFLASRRARRAGVPKGNRLLAVAIVLGIGGFFVTLTDHDAITGRNWHFYYLPSGSMEPTLLVGDYIAAVEGRANLRNFRRGDIIVSVDSDGIPYVRRLIGLPGDTVEVRDGRLYHNGVETPAKPRGTFEARWSMKGEVFAETLDERSYRTLDLVEIAADDFAETFVPDGHVFLLGDNRDNARDSRYIGPIAIKEIIGIAYTIYWSPERGRWRWPQQIE